MTAIGTHSISWGDTLSQIAQRYGTSIDALQALNPQITNPDLIYAGDTLRLSGAGAGGAEQGAATAVGAGAVEGRPLALDGANAAAIAEQFIGRNAGELKHSNELPMQSWVPDNVNCARRRRDFRRTDHQPLPHIDPAGIGNAVRPCQRPHIHAVTSGNPRERFTALHHVDDHATLWRCGHHACR